MTASEWSIAAPSAQPPIPSGPAAARPAERGTPSWRTSRKCGQRRAGRVGPTGTGDRRQSLGPSPRWRPAPASRSRRACPSWTACSAGGWSPARSPSSGASPASASPPWPCRWRRRGRRPARRRSTCRPRRARRRSATGPERLGALDGGLWLLSETQLPGILAALDDLGPALVVIDSIQTVADPEMESSPGSMVQVRESAHRLVQEAKQRERRHRAHRPRHQGGRPGRAPCAGARGRHRPVLRGRPSPRPAPAAGGQAPVRPHHRARGVRDGAGRPGRRGRRQRAVPGRPGVGIPGSAVVPIVEGHRPLLVEVQALVVPSTLPSPRRSAQGLDQGRLALLVAVLTNRAGCPSPERDVYASVVGGLRLGEPGSDLGVCLALASAHAGTPLGRRSHRLRRGGPRR